MSTTTAHEWSDPASMMLSGYSCLLFLIVLNLFGLIPPENIGTLGVLFVAIGLIFVVAGIIGIAKSESATGNLLGTFGFLFMLGPGSAYILSAAGIGGSGPLLGYYIVFLSPILLLWFPAFLAQPFLYFLILPTFFIGLIPLGLYTAQLGPSWLLQATQVVFVFALFLILYLLLESTARIGGYDLPLGSPIVTPESNAGPAPTPEDD